MNDLSYEELSHRVAQLEHELDALKASRPGRKIRPILLKEAGKCGLDPERDSETCPDASIYRYQKGCRGTACCEKNRTYYADYRLTRKGEAEAD